jgi:hypothetical protein
MRRQNSRRRPLRLLSRSPLTSDWRRRRCRDRETYRGTVEAFADVFVWRWLSDARNVPPGERDVIVRRVLSERSLVARDP